MKDTFSVFCCQFCEQPFCLSCFNEHSFVACTKGTKKSIDCSVHNMECKYYCLKCEVVTCIFCLTKKHYGVEHNFVLISAAEKDVRDRIQNLLNSGKDQTNRCKDLIDCFKEVIQRFTNLFGILENDPATDISITYLQQEYKVKTLMQKAEIFKSTISDYCEWTKKLFIDNDIFELYKIRANIPTEFTGEILHIDTKAITEPEYVMDDFYENMNLYLDESASMVDVESSEIRQSSTGESDVQYPVADFVRTMLPMYIKSKIGKTGQFNGEFIVPNGFCLNNEEDIIVADTYNHRIQVCVCVCW